MIQKQKTKKQKPSLLEWDETPITEQKDEVVLERSMEHPALFRILVDRYQDAFLRKAESIIHSREEAEDIVQETFTKIYFNARRFKTVEVPPSSLGDTKSSSILLLRTIRS